MTALPARAAALLDAWFGPPDDPARDRPKPHWFKPDPAFDERLRRDFADDHARALRGEYDGWTRTPEGAVALLLLLDQVPRNIYRNTPQAFAADAKAREIARLVVASGDDQFVPPVWRWFVYLPYEHSEDLADQTRSLELFAALPPSPDRDVVIDYARRHYDIVARFGRFPHRNAILGRASTAEEIEFLKQPGSVF
jgi:uncharacterized protein (DUF924 family)